MMQKSSFRVNFVFIITRASFLNILTASNTYVHKKFPKICSHLPLCLHHLKHHMVSGGTLKNILLNSSATSKKIDILNYRKL